MPQRVGRCIGGLPFEATREDLGISTLQSFTSFTSGTANIFESFDTDQYATLQQEYAGYSLVGILVYAVK